MKTLKNYLILIIGLLMTITMTGCDDKEEVEYNLPGTWYTAQNIDFGVYTWGEGTVMQFNSSHQGTIGTATDNDFLVFEWNWLNEGYNVMELYFYTDNSYAYIVGADASYNTFSGTWYNNYADFSNRRNGQRFIMRRQ